MLREPSRPALMPHRHPGNRRAAEPADCGGTAWTAIARGGTGGRSSTTTHNATPAGSRRRRASLCGLLVLLLALHATPVDAAAEATIELLPGPSSVGFRAYSFGLLPLNGEFTRFHGQFTYDPGAPAHCSVTLQADVASLAMAPAAAGDTVLGPDFLDAARFPALAYQGACGPEGLTGELTMHGVTRPFALALEWKPGAVTAAGRLRRADWGMTGRPLLGGSTVRITVRVPLPPAPRPGG
jgi:polyisoprenoid-binding protein YceI